MKISYVIAAVVAVGTIAWVLSGERSGVNSSPTASAETPAKTAAAPGAQAQTPTLATVRVRTQSAVSRPREVSVRAHTEASRQATVRTEIPGTLTQILVNKGDRVKAGQVIVRLDTSDRPARLAEAKAMVDQRQLEFNIAKSLGDKGDAPATRFAAAKAALESANTSVSRIQLEMAKVDIKAPFDGVIEDRPAQMGDVVAAGAAVAVIVDEDPFLVVGQVSENDVAVLRTGMKGTAKLVDGREIAGKIRFVATLADQQTRTFKVELEVPNPDKALRAGMTASIVVPVGETMAHYVSTAALVLDDQGRMGVKSVSAGGIVEFQLARVLGATDEGVWLDGLPPTLSIITVGQQFVRTGDVVRAVEDRG